MSTVPETTRLTGLAKRLVLDGLLDEPTAQQAHLKALEKKQSLVSYLVENKLATSKDIAHIASAEFGLPLVDISTVDIDVEVVKLVKDKLVRQHNTLPIWKRGSRLFLAVSDPTNTASLDEIKFNAGIPTEAILVEEDKLAKKIAEILDKADTTLANFDDKDLEDLDISSGDDLDRKDGQEGGDADEAPVVRFINKIMLDAINKGASDIHFEPYEKIFRVRLRVDGMLKEVAAPPVGLAMRMAARLKVMASLDVSERRLPQDGRIKLKISKNRAIDFRVNSCPTLFGEKIVLRILDPSSAKLGIDALGYEEDQKKLYLDALSKPYGMILVTGPTGSGKTVSLYTGLNILNTEDKNISTAEDPAEINMPGVNQVNVNPKVGLEFADALRAFLRQDPDVIMVGEIRDLETASIAVKAAQTGHLVLSTLHTNDAPQTLTRLANMGVPPFNIASSVMLIIAQRLARRLCEKCKQPANIPEGALVEEGFTPEQIKKVKSGAITIYKHVGCEYCTDGYKGRVGIYQVMPISDEISRIIMENGNSIEIADQARKEGISDLRESGLKKVLQGITSLEELNRVTRE